MRETIVREVACGGGAETWVWVKVSNRGDAIVMGVGRESSDKGLEPECVGGFLARVMRD